MPGYKGLPVKELEHMLHDNMKERAKLKDEAVKIHAALDAANAEAEIKRRVDAMSDAERAALAQYVKSNGIPSSEALGRPGA